MHQVRFASINRRAELAVILALWHELPARGLAYAI